MRLSKRVIRKDTLPEALRFVAGVDVAYLNDWSFGAVAVLDYATFSLVEVQKARVKTDFPYVPTLLSWREIKPAKAAIRKLKTAPDIFLVDAQGIAHPYRFGFASHLGLELDKPTVGVAKSLLCGQVQAPNAEGRAPILDKGEVIGAVVRKDRGGQPLYVSIGHRVSLERALEIVEHYTVSTGLPEPIRIAHKVATEEKMKYRQQQRNSS